MLLEGLEKRYFLYRLFESGDGAFELAILQDPLRQKAGLIPAVHVVMQRSDTMQKFSINGGLARGRARTVAETGQDHVADVGLEADSDMALNGYWNDIE